MGKNKDTSDASSMAALMRSEHFARLLTSTCCKILICNAVSKIF